MSPIFGTTWSLPVSQQDLPDWQQRLSGRPVCCSGGRNKRSFARGHFACRAELVQRTGSSFSSLDMAAEELLVPTQSCHQSCHPARSRRVQCLPDRWLLRLRFATRRMTEKHCAQQMIYVQNNYKIITHTRQQPATGGPNPPAPHKVVLGRAEYCVRPLAVWPKAEPAAA